MKNLTGKIIISTRPKSENDILIKTLMNKGAEIILFPMIEITGIDFDVQTDIKNFKSFSWIVFTSHNGVKFFFDNLLKQNSIEVISPNIKIAVIGNRTSKELEIYGFKADYISKSKTSESFLEELLNNILCPKDNVLLVLGASAKNTLFEGLSHKICVTRLNVYQTRPVTKISQDIMDLIIKDKYDIIIFASPSAVNNFCKLFHNKINLSSVKASVIGETTAKFLINHNVIPLLISTEPDGEMFAKEIANYLSQKMH